VSNVPTPDPQLDALVGQVVAGKYHVVEPIARGGMSRIYRAMQLPLGRPVALKLLTPLSSLGPESELRERFLREAATCARLRHPNTVTIHDYGTLDGTGMLFMVMEFVDGRNLAQEIRLGGPIEPARAAKIACEVLRSLHEAHTMGVIHRDLKSSNIMLVQTIEGEAVKVVDFGIAKVLDAMEGEPDGVTLGNAVLGSPGYMAPEQIVGGTIDPRTDVYAVGAVLYEMLSGRRPFRGETSFQTMMAHIQEDPIPLRDVCPYRISDELNAVIEACLSKNPGARPESAAALLARLRAAVPEMPWSSSITLDFRRTDVFNRAQLGLGPVPSKLPRPHMMVGGVLIGFLLTAWLLALATASFALYATMEAGQVSPIGTPTLTIRSTPPGAEVFRGETSLGHTPLVVAIAADGPDQVYRLELDGFEPISITQGPAAESEVMDIELEASAPEQPEEPEAPAAIEAPAPAAAEGQAPADAPGPAAPEGSGGPDGSAAPDAGDRVEPRSP
jgi:eukaryotic-like serine/threonine-protein kinase